MICCVLGQRSASPIIKRRNVLSVLLAVFVSALPSSPAESSDLYRYKNRDGVVVLNYSVPPEYVSGGYQVLTKDGIVLETVPPHDASNASSKPEAGVDQARERENQFILASYVSTGEIEEAKNRKLKQLAREIELVESNLAETRQLRIREQSRAANYQRSGQVIPENVASVLAGLDEQERKTRSILLIRRAEYRDVEKLYDRYRQRFVELTSPAGATPNDPS